MELNPYGKSWVDKHLAKIDDNQVYAAIGAYDPDALERFRFNEEERLTKIAINHQDDPEFQMQNSQI